MPDLADLQGTHAGETVWVLGSGPSLNFIDAGFFADKIVISTNFSAESLGFEADFVFSHYHSVIAQLLPSDITTFVTLGGDTVSHEAWAGYVPENLVFAEQDSYNAPGSGWDPFTRNPPKEGSLAYGSSSLHGAMHLAAHVGASSIVLVGADCGTINGSHRMQDYPVDGHKPWALYNAHHKLMKDWLVNNYGVAIHSLNPFINLNLEGHKFEGV